MTATTEPVATPPKHSAAGDLKTQRMPFGRWMRLVGWRHVVAVVMIVWALFPVFYVVTLSFSGGQTLTSACSPDLSGFQALSCLVPHNSTSATTRRC